MIEKNQTENISKKFSKKIFKIIDDFIFIVNTDYKILYFNKNDDSEFLEYPKNEVINKKFLSIIDERDVNSFTKICEDSKDKSKNRDIIRLKSKSGKLLTFKIKISLTENENFLIYLRRRPNNLRDIFDIKNNAKLLFESLVSTISDAIIISDINAKIILISEKALKLSGFNNKESFIGKSSFDFLHPSNKERAIKNLKKTLNDGKIEGAKYKFLKKDGSYYLGKLNVSLIKDPENNPIGFIGVIKDITQQEATQKKYEDSEEKYRNMINNLDLGFYRISWQGKVLNYNDAFRRILGVKQDDEINNFNSFDFLQINHERKNFFQKLLEDEKVKNYTIHTKPVYGKEKIVQLNSHLLRDASGEPSIIEGTITDITEKYELEQKLRQSEKKYHTLFDGANDAIFIMERYMFIECNEKTLDIFGCDNESDIIGEYPWHFSPVKQPNGENSKEKAIEAINRCLHGESQRFYWKHLRKDGETFDAEIALNRFVLGKRILVQAIVRDITSQMQVEENLSNSEQKYRHLFKNSPFSIMLLSHGGKIVDCNTATVDLLGYSQEEMIGTNYTNLPVANEKFRKIILERFNKTITDIKLPPIEIKLRKKDGQDIWVEVESSHVKVENQDLIQIIGHNVTDRKKAEKLIKEEFKRLKDLDQMRKDLISRVSHELKTPLMSIDGASELLQMLHKDKLDKEALNLIKMIKKGGKRLNSLVNNLIDISRIEYRKLELEKIEKDLSQIIQETTAEIKPMAKRRELRLNVDLPNKLKIEVDQYRIEQVITNLLSNAIKNTPPKGKIKVKLERNKDWAIFSVSDTGIGLTDLEIERLFKRFGKIERYGSGLEYIDIQGSGLGLFISKEIVKLHGGNIWAQSNGRNMGSKFFVKLPIN